MKFLFIQRASQHPAEAYRIYSLSCLFKKKKKDVKIFLATYFSCSCITSWSSAPQVTLVCLCYDFYACVALRSPNSYTVLY